MKRSQRLQPVVDIAGNGEREAARRLGEARGTLQRAEQQLAELRQFRDEYAAGFATSGEGGLTTSALLGYRRFLTQLNVAIEQQVAIVDRARHGVQQRVVEWRQRRSRLQALEKVSERLHQDELDREERQEQAESDDRGQHNRNGASVDWPE